MTHIQNILPRPLARSAGFPWFVFGLCCVALSGCNWNIPKGEGFSDEMSNVSKHMRQQEKSDGTPLGTSNKALEIERNLGYR